eukprot:TRINITY_DN57691_c0_g1_i1.p1 TRINITY_DN57691_c0_g1~~TRINITY_DN57691_c0_g1_i1.p1  ORF type:complete len:1041 (+),score=168.26 TRINITY_DN57691_c0_g1_i1:71-3193(+)
MSAVVTQPPQSPSLPSLPKTSACVPPGLLPDLASATGRRLAVRLGLLREESLSAVPTRSRVVPSTLPVPALPCMAQTSSVYLQWRVRAAAQAGQSQPGRQQQQNNSPRRHASAVSPSPSPSKMISMAPSPEAAVTLPVLSQRQRGNVGLSPSESPTPTPRRSDAGCFGNGIVRTDGGVVRGRGGLDGTHCSHAAAAFVSASHTAAAACGDTTRNNSRCAHHGCERPAVPLPHVPKHPRRVDSETCSRRCDSRPTSSSNDPSPPGDRNPVGGRCVHSLRSSPRHGYDPLDFDCQSGGSTYQVPLAGMEMLCRGTVQELVKHQGRMLVCAAHKRHAKSLACSQFDRERAKAWRTRTKQRVRRELAAVRVRAAEEVARVAKASEILSEAAGEEATASSDEAGAEAMATGVSEMAAVDAASRQGVSRQSAHSSPSPSASPPSQTGVARAFRRRRLLRVNRRKTKKSLHGSVFRKGQAQQQPQSTQQNVEEWFSRLPGEERQIVETVYQRHQADGVLSPDKVRTALHDLGVCGLDGEERRIIAAIINSQRSASDVARFTAEIVMPCRRLLAKRRVESLQQNILLCSRDVDGHLLLPHLLSAAQLLLPWELLDDDDDDDETAKFLRGEVERECRSFVATEKGHQQFVERLMGLGEEMLRHQMESVRKVQSTHGLSDEQVQEHRNDLIALQRCFDKVDIDDSGFLDREEVKQLMVEYEIMPQKTSDIREHEALIASIDRVNFADFLVLVDRIREMQREQVSWVELEDFVLQTKLHDGNAETREVSIIGLRKLLQDIGLINPSVSTATSSQCSKSMRNHELIRTASARRNDHLAIVLQLADPDGREMFTLDVVETICQRLEELRKFEGLLALERLIRRCGFSHFELKHIRLSFALNDHNNEGTLNKKQVQSTLKSLGMKLEPEFLFHAAFKMLDEDGSGFLEFPEFLKLMKMVRDEEGVFQDLDTAVTTIEMMTRIDLVRVLDIFGLVWEEVDALSHQELVETVSELMDIGQGVALGAVMNIDSVNDLLESARHSAAVRKPTTASERS